MPHSLTDSISLQLMKFLCREICKLYLEICYQTENKFAHFSLSCHHCYDPKKYPQARKGELSFYPFEHGLQHTHVAQTLSWEWWRENARWHFLLRDRPCSFATRDFVKGVRRQKELARIKFYRLTVYTERVQQRHATAKFLIAFCHASARLVYTM